MVFSEPVTDFDTGDVTLSGTAGATTGGCHRQRHDLQRGGQRHDRRGTVIATIAGGRGPGCGRQPNTASPAPTTPSRTTSQFPTVTINQAAGQADPTNASPINFTVVFSEPVTGFTGRCYVGWHGRRNHCDGHRHRHHLQCGGQRHDRRHGDRPVAAVSPGCGGQRQCGQHQHRQHCDL